MAKDMCLNATTTMDTSKYSAPVPIIGLYIAVGSLICFLLILCDVWAGFRRKKFWFPCRFFSLNSITLTLIFSITSKIPVDLTTDMPSAHDQLAKLTGTVFICMTVGFMNPSVGDSGEFESYANVTALTISVVTVFVNVCVQMATGVIYSFIVEHSIILFCMLLLIVQSWLSVVEINVGKADFGGRNSERLERGGEGNVLNWLRHCYIDGYIFSPQYTLCTLSYLNIVPLVCSSCSVVLIVAILKSLDLKFCGGVSDYDWSVLLIVVSQILTILLVSLAIGFRWLTIGGMNIWDFVLWRNLVGTSRICYLQFLHLFTSINLWKPLEVSFKFVIYYPLFIIEYYFAILNLVLVSITNTAIMKLCTSQSGSMDGAIENRRRIRLKATKDMDQWMKKAKDDAPKCLIELLRNIPPTQESLSIGQDEENRFSSLSILLLVELAKLATPASLHVSLINILGEVFESIHFIDENVNVGNVENRKRCRYAKIIWKYGLFHKFSIRGSCKNATTVQFQLQLDRAFDTIKERLDEMVMINEAESIADSLGHQLDLNSLRHRSPEEIYNRIQQVFVDRLHGILPQLPHAIFKYMVNSHFEEYESRTRFGMRLICRFKCLEEHMSLFFPDKSVFNSFYTASPTDDTQTILDAASRGEIQV